MKIYETRSLVKLDFFAVGTQDNRGGVRPVQLLQPFSKQRSEGQVAVANDLHSVVQ